MNSSQAAKKFLQKHLLRIVDDKDDIIFQVFCKDVPFQNILEDLLWKYESTEQKQKRTDCFVYGIFAFHLDLFLDIEDLPVSPSVICDIHNLRKTGVLTYNLKNYHRHHFLDMVLFRFFRRVNALVSLCLHGTEFNVNNKYQEKSLREGLVEYHTAQNHALSSGDIFRTENRYAFRTYGSWLVHSQRIDLLEFISPFQHLFAYHIEDYGEMHLAIKNAVKNPAMFKCLYNKGVRKTAVDTWTIRVHIDTHDGGIPYELIQNHAMDALEWYILNRKENDMAFQSSLIEILAWYYEVSVDIHGYEHFTTTRLMQIMSRERIQRYKEELMKVTWHPKRVQWWMDFEEYHELFVE